MNLLTCAIISLGLVSTAFCDPTTRPATNPARPEIRAATKLGDREPGILVKCPHSISVSKNPKGEIEVTYVNLLDEEVFIEVTEVSLSYSIETKEGTVDGGGGGVFFPDNVPLLKRLHAGWLVAGRRVTCGCGIARVSTAVTVEKLQDWVGGVATVQIPVAGFCRTTGERFHVSVEAKIDLVP